MTSISFFDRLVKPNSKIHRYLQRKVASIFFGNPPDWYKNHQYKNINHFIEVQKLPVGRYYGHFITINLTSKSVHAQLTTGEVVQLEGLKLTPEESEENRQKPGYQKHIVYFQGAGTHYQACFRDLSACARETGATVHAFNYPGICASKGKLHEANDLVNAGMGVVIDLLKQGVHPDNIILLGDCYGSGIATLVKEEFKKQSNIEIRIVLKNAFKSFFATIKEWLSNMLWGIPLLLKYPIKALLNFTGWNIRPGKVFKHAGPYQCYLQVEKDETVNQSSLKNKVKKYKEESETQTTKSKKRKPILDDCPEAYKADRDYLEAHNTLRIKESEIKHIRKAAGVGKDTDPNPHFADLCELETLTGESAYTGFVNDYLERSNNYIQSHPQTMDEINIPKFLPSAATTPIPKKDAKQMFEVIKIISHHCHQDPKSSLVYQRNRSGSDVNPNANNVVVTANPPPAF